MTGQTTARAAGGGVETATISYTGSNGDLAHQCRLFFTDTSGHGATASIYKDSGTLEVMKGTVLTIFTNKQPEISGDISRVDMYFSDPWLFVYSIDGDCRMDNIQYDS